MIFKKIDDYMLKLENNYKIKYQNNKENKIINKFNYYNY